MESLKTRQNSPIKCVENVLAPLILPVGRGASLNNEATLEYANEAIDRPHITTARECRYQLNMVEA